MEIPSDIVEARRLLEAAEREADPDRKLSNLKEGIDLIELCLGENSSATQEVSTFVKNVRRAHTRRLLVQLVSMERIDILTSVRYIVLIFIKLQDDVSHVTENDPQLKNNLEEFKALWASDIKEALEQSEL